MFFPSEAAPTVAWDTVERAGSPTKLDRQRAIEYFQRPEYTWAKYDSRYVYVHILDLLSPTDSLHDCPWIYDSHQLAHRFGSRYHSACGGEGRLAPVARVPDSPIKVWLCDSGASWDSVSRSSVAGLRCIKSSWPTSPICLARCTSLASNIASCHMCWRTRLTCFQLALEL